METNQSKLFFDLIQVALGTKETLSRVPTETDWRFLFKTSNHQAVTGVAFDAVKELSRQNATYKPPFNILMEWIGQSEQIKQRNILTNRRCVELTKMFNETGFNSCILKGQGNSLLYPNVFSRTPGDIDIWVKGDRKDIIKFVKKRTPKVFEQYHHIDFPIFQDVPVEVHFTPANLTHPRYWKQFQKYSEDAFEEEQKHMVLLPNEEILVSVSTLKFNVVYQMAHMMIHFFDEGIGLRHLIDYFFVLKKFQFVDSDMQLLFKQFGFLKFAKGVMWVEKNLLGLEDKYLIVEPSEKIGKVIMSEMLEGGNFGHYDERYTLRKYGLWGRAASDGYRLLTLSSSFPSEVIWKLIWKVKNQKWKMKN